VSLVTGPMLDAVAEHAKWIDVFVERGAFDEDQGRAILEAGLARGLQAGSTPTSSARARRPVWRAPSAPLRLDHCTYLTDADIDALASTGVVAGLLPAIEFSTRSPYPNARRLLDAASP
jgi:imidazolonepropionase